mmetsp:Transcript_13795/g.35441  ORF Transcript_13795/g.35441 Transcript_13795/m.35441 type:complete len:177 (+) Transcript_13795:447-977(+)|eukprot:jgi/Tetstr1/426642/TSEL_016918.t1
MDPSRVRSFSKGAAQPQELVNGKAQSGLAADKPSMHSIVPAGPTAADSFAAPRPRMRRMNSLEEPAGLSVDVLNLGAVPQKSNPTSLMPGSASPPVRMVKGSSGAPAPGVGGPAIDMLAVPGRVHMHNAAPKMRMSQPFGSNGPRMVRATSSNSRNSLDSLSAEERERLMRRLAQQ